MDGSLWLILAIVIVAGALGGVVNAFITDNGFLLPKSEKASTGATVLRPGYLGNVFVGAVAALVSWGLYGPLSSYVLVGSAKALTQNPSPARIGLSLASFVGAILVGIGGARWLSNEVDKNLLRVAASSAASVHPSDDAAKKLALATPAQALHITNEMTAAHQ